MTTGIKQTVSDIKYGDPFEPYSIKYNVELDCVFAIGAVREAEMERIVKAIDEFEDNDRCTLDEYLRWAFHITLDEADELIELLNNAVEISSNLWQYDPPTMKDVKRWLYAAGTDLMLDAYKAGVFSEYLVA